MAKHIRHPDHDQLTQLVRDWFYLPFERMGYRAEKRRWGTYWSTGMIYPTRFPTDQVESFLADLRKYYGATDLPLVINTTDVERDGELGPALLRAGCIRGKTDVFLAHVGPAPPSPTVAGLEVEAVDDPNLHDYAETRLKGFADSEDTCEAARLQAEMRRRRKEMAETGRT